jgi:hypothetical protein
MTYTIWGGGRLELNHAWAACGALGQVHWALHIRPGAVLGPPGGGLTLTFNPAFTVMHLVLDGAKLCLESELSTQDGRQTGFGGLSVWFLRALLVGIYPLLNTVSWILGGTYSTI